MGSWTAIVGTIAVLWAVLVPFAPDEKLNRLKLETLEVGLLALLAAVVLRTFIGRDRARPDRSLVAAVLAWLAVNAGLALVSADRALAMRELLRVATVSAGFLAFAFAALDGIWLRRFLAAWTASAALVALYGILQRSGGIGALLVPKMDRVMATFGNPIFFSAYLLPSIFVAAAAAVLAGRSLLRSLVPVAIMIQLAALILTATRSAFLALAGTLAVGALMTRDRRLRAAAGVALIAAAVALYAWAGRDQAHGLLWRDTLKLWTLHPAAGVGLGSFHVNLPDVAGADLKAKWPAGAFVVNFAHNEYLQTLAEGGPAALLALLAVIGAFLIALRRRITDPVVALIGFGAMAGFIQNVASADFRFTVSQTMTFALMGVVASRGPSSRTEPLSLKPSVAVPVGIFLSLGLLGLAAHRIAHFRSESAAATAPGFFDARVVNPEKAIADLSQRAASGNPDDLENLALLYARQMKRPDGSLDVEMTRQATWAYTRLIEIDPERASAHNNLANILFTSGRTEPAAVEWHKAADLDPRYVDPRLNLGKTAYVRGDLKEAARWFQDVLKIDPNNAEAALYLRRMVE